VPGPKTAAEALVWIQTAVVEEKYIVDQHLIDQCAARKFSVADVKKIIATATQCLEYKDGPNLANGTGWRVCGVDLDGTPGKVGVEAYKDHLGKQVILITVMDG
jgi:hypothetical protein